MNLDELKRGLPFIALFIFGVSVMFVTYSVGGVYWDFIAYDLFAKSLLTPSFYSAFLSHSLFQAVNYQNAFYYEYFRAPLTPVIMVPLTLLFGQLLEPAYLLLIVTLLAASVFYLSRCLETDPWLSLALFSNAYALTYLSILNGSEMLTMALAMFAAGLVVKGKWQAGILMALAGLAKYPSLIFLPLLLLLKGRERRLAMLAFALTYSPWLIFNACAFSNPLYGPLSSLSVFGSGNTALFPMDVFANSLFMVLDFLFPAFILLAALLLCCFYFGKAKGKRPQLPALPSDIRYRVVIALFALGLLGFLLVSIHSNMNNLPRHGYLLYVGVAVATSFAMGLAISFIRKKGGVRIAKAAYAAVFVAYAALLVCSLMNTHSHYVFGQYGANNPALQEAISALGQRGLANCSVVSNAWVYLRYFGVQVHSPYYYNATIQRYPIVLFYDIGVPISVVDTGNVTQTYTYGNFLIELPYNYACVR